MKCVKCGEEEVMIITIYKDKPAKTELICSKCEDEASRGEQACGMPLAVNPQEPHRRKGEITEVASRKSKANREPLASSPRIPESLICKEKDCPECERQARKDAERRKMAHPESLKK